MVSVRCVLALWAVVALLAAFAGAAQAQDKAPTRPATTPYDERSIRVEEALRVSHLKAYLATIRARLLGYLDADQTGSETRQRIARSVKTAHSPEAYLSSIKLALLQRFDADALARVTTWYRSPIGRRLVRLDEAAQEPGPPVARRKYFAALEDKQPSDYRLVLIFSIDEAAQASAGIAGALQASIDGWSLGIERLGGGGKPPEIRQVEAAISKYRAQIRDDVADDVLRELMFTYRDASDADLRGYAEFLESDAGKWFIGSALTAHRAYFESATDKIAEDLVISVTRKDTPPLLRPLRRPPHPTLSPIGGEGFGRTR